MPPNATTNTGENAGQRARQFMAKAYPPPPFNFQGVTARVFPLKANLHKLQRLCDEFFNIPQGKEQKDEFRPVVPYVFLVVIRYEKMYSEESPTEDLFERKGSNPWVSQNEVAFVFQTEWRKKENDQMVFNNWAYFAPYVFVDSDLSVVSGREVYGWRKFPAWFTAGPDSDPWLTSPTQQTTRLMTIRTTDIPWENLGVKKLKREFKFGENEVLKKLLTIDKKEPVSFAQYFPFYNPLDLLLSGPRLTLEGLGALFEGVGLLGTLPIVGARTAADRSLHAAAIAKGLRGLGKLLADGPRDQIFQTLFPGFSYGDVKDLLSQKLNNVQDSQGELLSLEQITLKQFDETSDPEKFCYQSIVRSSITVTRYKNGGLLGDARVLPVDPTGGFQVRLYYSGKRDESVGAQIIDALGLEHTELRQKEKVKVGTEEKEVSVVLLNPFYPLWFEGDLSYSRGENVWKKSREQ